GATPIPDCRDSCVDVDGDGYGRDGQNSGCAGHEDVDDCNDAEPACNTSCTSADGDATPDCMDCDATSSLCTVDCDDADKDGVFDCKDDCLDEDGDGFGADLPGGACVGDDCDDARPFCNESCV